MERPVNRPQLTIELRRDGANLVRRYHLPDSGRIACQPPAPGSFAAIGESYRAHHEHGLRGLNAALTLGTAEALDRCLSGARLDSAGALLFEILFGTDEHGIQQLIREAASIKEPHPTPIRARLRARIFTDLPELLGLPWRVTQWKGYLLRDYDWTFEVCQVLAPRARIDHRSPGRVLVIAPPEPAPLAGPPPPTIQVEQHVEDLSALLDNVAPGFGATGALRIARSRDEVEQALTGFGADFVYFYGHGEVHEAKPYLRLGDGVGDRLAIPDFAFMLRHRPPRVVFLNGCWTAAGGWHAAGHQLLPHVPLVIANGTAADADAARRYALEWLEAWLGRGVEPVVAAHARPKDTTRLSAWTPAVVYTDYETWETSRPPNTRIRLARAEDWLDRKPQRAIALSYVADLVRHERQRVEALLVYGLPGNSLERVFQQIIDHIAREAGDRIHIRRLNVPFPDLREPELQAAHFEQDLKAHFGLGLQDKLATALGARAPLPKGNAARVLWLDFGVLRDCDRFNDLFTFLAFARDYLASTEFEGFHVVASLALEAEGEAYTELATMLPGLRGEGDLWTDRFRCAALDPVGGVSLVDVLQFLEDHGCDQDLVRDLAGAIFQATNGKHDTTTEKLREGLRLGWRVLFSQFPKPRPPRMFGEGRKR